MQFNSLTFAAFFIITYALYLVLEHRWQNRLLLLASYVFYCFWDWRFLSLIILSTIFNYYLGQKIDLADKRPQRKRLLAASICLNLAILGFFKYFSFFADNLRVLLWAVGWKVDRVTLSIILPLGISFYTFQAMSYPIDIYRSRIKSTRYFPDFALFVAFFPQLVAGPIERARNLIPQITGKRHVTLDKFYSGCWLIAFGLYKKMFIADNLARIAQATFSADGGPGTLVATYAFALQVYADFSGYSDMARGLARLMGFDIMQNFRTPFFAPTINKFWERWHISLTTWIKEYVFYPLALIKVFGRRVKAPLVVVLAWSVMGFWHGASWKFVLWGVYHGIIIVLYNKLRPYIDLIRPKQPFVKGLWTASQTFIIFNLFCVGILFFAAESVSKVGAALRGILIGFTVFNQSILLSIGRISLLFVLPLFIIEYFQFKSDDEMVVLKWHPAIRAIIYLVLFYSIITYGDFSVQRYYYFQF